MKTLHQTQDLPISLQEAWDFFSSPRNLEELTPSWLKFEITHLDSEKMREGQKIQYRIQLAPMVKMNWVTEIQEVEEGRKFVDTQEKGPYSTWHHTHTFKEIPGGVRMEDIVRFDVGWGPIGWVAHKIYVDRSVAKIFDYRREIMEEKFGKVTLAKPVLASA